jgi:hypothetical protein
MCNERDAAPQAAFLLVTHYSSLITVFVTGLRAAVGMNA